MAKKHKPRLLRAKGAFKGVEWIGGIVSLPTYVTGEGEPYRPEALLWMNGEGVILGSTMERPGEVLGVACESLQGTTEQPIFGAPHAPARIRVASEDLADVLRAGCPTIEIVCGPTPEFDEVAASMREHLRARDAGDTPYYLSMAEPPAVASFFRAAAALFRTEPWRVVPSDQDLFTLNIEALGVRDVVVSVIGQLGENLGLMILDSLEHLEAIIDVADQFESGAPPEVPPYLALNFERFEDAPPALGQEVAEHGWEVASEDAYPWLVAADEDIVSRPPTVMELAVGEATALALAAVLRDGETFRPAWEHGEPVSRTVTVRTHSGDVDVTLSAPCIEPDAYHRSTVDVLDELGELDPEAGDLDPLTRGPLEEELLLLFETAPEADGLEDLSACRAVMDFAADYFGATIATLRPSDLREIIFEIIPRKVSIDASEARWVIDPCGALYAFLEREAELPQAPACLDVLGGTAVKDLEEALSDPRNFGMAKSVLMAGRDAGFDIDSREGLEAWMKVAQNIPLPERFGRPPSDPPPSAPAKPARKAKKKRKAARKARKKNR